ncbi:MAG: hypothetical protein ACM3Z4_06915 [Hyphomicrobiales bacterium]
MEREGNPAVDLKPCTKIGNKTMYVRLCTALALIQILAAPAFAADEKKLPGPQPFNPFQGTPEEQAACAPDATRFCKDLIPDSLRVLGCLQDHRQRIRKVCLKVLEDNGQ